MGSRRQDVDVEVMILRPDGARAYIKSLVTSPRRDHFDKMSDEDILIAAAKVHKEELRFAESELRILRGCEFPLH